MVAPYNYILPNQPNPLEAAVSGLRLGATIEEIQAARQQRAMQIEAQQAAAARAKQGQEVWSRVMQNPTAQGIMELSAYVPDSVMKNVVDTFKTMNEGRQKGYMSAAGQALAALEAGQPTIAVERLRQYSEAAKNAGDAEGASMIDFYANMVEKAPNVGFATIGTMISKLPGGKETLEGIGAMRKEGRDTAMFPAELERKKAEAEKARVEANFAERVQQAGLDEKKWNVKNISSQIGDRSQRLKLDQQRLELDTVTKMAELNEKVGTLPPAAQEAVNKSAIEAGVNKQQADSYLALAQRLRKDVGTSWGALGSASEFLKRATGSQDAVSTARQEYARVRNQLVSKNLPPGAASDKDVELLMKGFPPENASPAVLAEFLEAQARVAAAGAALENARADWLAQNRGSLARSKNTFIAGDYTVKPGETWPEFSARVAKDVQKKTLETLTGPGPAQIPQNVPPGGAPARNPVLDAADAILRGGR